MHTRAFAIGLLLSITFRAPAATRLRFEEGAHSRQMRLSAGSNHTCAVLDDGSVRCWGTNADGELGDGTITTTPKTAVKVSGSGNALAACADGMIEIPMAVPARGPAGFRPGAATAKVEALVRVHGDLTEDQHWTRAVVLTPEL